MALPGFIKIYNRMPHDVSFQCDMKQYVLEPYSEETVTIAMAVSALKQSIYKWNLDGTYCCGVVVQGDECYGVPLTTEDLHLADPLAAHEVELNPNSEEVEYWPIRVNQVGAIPTKPKPLSKEVQLIPGEKTI